MEQVKTSYEQLLDENNELRIRLEEANDTLEAIRTGQVDALIVRDGDKHQVYTLKTADQTYRVFIEKMNEGAVTINRDGLILYSNTRFAEMVNMTLEKVIGLSFVTLVAERSRKKFSSIIKKGWQEDCKEEIYIGTRQQEIPCLLSCNTLDLDEGVALSLILTDLTILKETEEKLKTKNEQLAAAQFATEKLNNELEDTVRDRTNELFLSREHFKHLANNIPQITWTSLPDGEVNYYNEKWYSYTGLSHEESINGGWDKVIHPDDVKNSMEKYRAALKSGEVFENENRIKRNSDGAYRWHLNRAVPLRNEEGEIVFWAGTATDIEDQKKEMEKRDEFIGIASHELRTPLTSVKGYLQLISAYKKEDVPAVIKQHISKANTAIGKLQHLINDLLDVSKIQAGRLEYAFAPVNITALIKTSLENAGHIYAGYTFVYEPENDFWVLGNAERLEQVLMNLLNNAVKYSTENKKIMLKTCQNGHMVRISVIDFGIGLSEDQKERIFERFYRVEDRKYLAAGLGMGLYISAEIITNHNGEIGVESELGKGATFYFELPLIEPQIES
jgi:two-component system phosphate regulon sensor histidine kinase PhoR